MPCLFICFGYNLAQSVAVWNAVYLLVSGWRVIHSVSNKEMSPEGNRPIIDFDSVLMFQPSIFIGIECGFIVMEVLPEGVKLVGFALMLATLTYFTMRKALVRYRQECVTMDESSPLTRKPAKQAEEQQLAVMRGTQTLAEPYLPVKKVLINFISLVLLTLSNLVLGSRHSASLVGIRVCSPAYWSGLVVYFGILILVLWFSYWYVKREREKRMFAGLEFLQSDFEWTRNLVLKTFALAVLSGFFSSSYGIGGGIILNMVLIYKGVDPNMVTMTTMLSIFFICVSTTIAYSIKHILPLDGYAITLIALSLPTTIVSYLWLKRPLQKHASVVLFVLTIALGVSAVLVVCFGFYKAYYIDHNDRVWKFGGICP